ncbi:Eukaryotic translation initiation factor 2B, subunit 4 delta, 67kDa, partial [Entophlyctis luteolus]
MAKAKKVKSPSATSPQQATATTAASPISINTNASVQSQPVPNHAAPPSESSPVGSLHTTSSIAATVAATSTSSSAPKHSHQPRNAKPPKETRSLEEQMFSPASALPPVVPTASPPPEKKFKDMTPEEQRAFKEKGEAEKLAKKLAKQQKAAASGQQQSSQQQQQQQPQHLPQPQQQHLPDQAVPSFAKQPSGINATVGAAGLASSPSVVSASTSSLSAINPPNLSSMSSQANMRASSQIKFDDVKHQKRALVKGRTLAQKPVPLLSHLTQFEKSGMGAARAIQLLDNGLLKNNMLHPAIVSLGVQFSEFIIAGGIARCLAMLSAFKKVIADYVTPPGTAIQRNLNSYLSKQIDHLTTTRHLAQTMKFAIRQLKSEVSNMSIEMSDEDSKAHLLSWIDTFIKERIISADESIVEKALEKIKNGDVILVFGRSAVVERLLLQARETNINFRVIVSDARPKLEGKILLNRLVARGIDCTYVMVSSLGAVIPKVTKLIIGASALLSNGAVLSRAGTAMVAMMAQDAHVPVMVLCELIKFSDLVQLDSFVWNEIGDPDELVNVKTQSPWKVLPSVLSPPSQDSTGTKQRILKDWREVPELKLLNLHYDITPAQFITLVICENGCIPSTSVLSVIANMKIEEEKNLKKIYSDSKRRVQLLGLNILRPLLGLTSSKETAIKKAAAACIAATTELAEIHNEMRKKELLETIVSLLSPDEPAEVQDEAAFALANLAKDFSIKAEIRKVGGIKALVKLLPSTDPDVRKNVALALSLLMEDFSNRTEIRYVNGLGPLLELLGEEFPEIQENTLMSLILSAEDHANRIEIRRLNGVRRLIDMLGQDLPELHHLTLTCISKCLEDSETVNIFPEINGLPPIIKMLSSDDVRNKKNASLVLSKVAKTDRNQNFIRDAGALPVLTTNISHSDVGTVSHAALALGNLAKNEINQLEMNKSGLVETFFKLISHEDVDVCRQSTFALSSLCLNAKIRFKIKTNELIGPIMKLFALDDPQTLVNACECVANLAEDTVNRQDIIKLGGVQMLMALLNRSETVVQSAACLALAR